MKPMKYIYIYAIVVRSNFDVKYVGQSKHPINRLSGHMGYWYSPVATWFRKRRQKAAIVILESCHPSMAFDRERYWIKRFLKRGYQLVNIDLPIGFKNISSQTQIKLDG